MSTRIEGVISVIHRGRNRWNRSVVGICRRGGETLRAGRLVGGQVIAAGRRIGAAWIIRVPSGGAVVEVQVDARRGSGVGRIEACIEEVEVVPVRRHQKMLGINDACDSLEFHFDVGDGRPRRIAAHLDDRRIGQSLASAGNGDRAGVAPGIGRRLRGGMLDNLVEGAAGA